MTQEELTERYKELYGIMETSNEQKYMKLFGDVMSEMMGWMIKNQPQVAESMIEKLCAVNWEQYLTKAEATKIVSKMIPQAAWVDFDTWNKALTGLRLETERKGVFNAYALWVKMNAMYSKHIKAIAEYAFETPVDDIDSEKLVKLIHALAVDVLADADGVFDIRKYYLNR